MQITPQIKQQLEEQKKHCFVCKINNHEIPSQIVFDDHTMSIFLDANPAVKGHMLMATKNHYPILPYVQPEEYNHIFGLIPKLIKETKKATLTTGANVFIASGAQAGQQAPNLLIHIIPRENDNFNYFSFTKSKVTPNQESIAMLAKNMNIMMQNHFSRQPASWQKEKVQAKEHLKEKKVLYADPKAVVTLPNYPQSQGHLEVRSPIEPSLIENLSEEDCAHLFYVASYAATAVFEGLGAHGTNIILKTGKSSDNPEGELVIHIIPRTPDDGLNFMWTPKSGAANEQIASKLRDRFFYITYKPKKEKVIDLDKYPHLLPGYKQTSTSKQNQPMNEDQPLKKLSPIERAILNEQN